MRFVTKLFGEVDIDDSKMLTFEEGIIGYPYMQHYFIIYDSERKKKSEISWLQSVEEPTFALPIINPLLVMPNYNPNVADEILSTLGECDEEGYLVFSTIRVPSDLTQMSVNLSAPIIINPKTGKCCQVIIENASYPVRFPVYEILKGKNGKEGE